LRESAPNHDEKIKVRKMVTATQIFENVRTLVKTFDLAVSINVTVAILQAMYAKMQA
jgi:hypothetical protein